MYHAVNFLAKCICLKLPPTTIKMQTILKVMSARWLNREPHSVSLSYDGNTSTIIHKPAVFEKSEIRRLLYPRCENSLAKVSSKICASTIVPGLGSVRGSGDIPSSMVLHREKKREAGHLNPSVQNFPGNSPSN